MAEKVDKWLTIRCKIPVSTPQEGSSPEGYGVPRVCGFFRKYRLMPDGIDVSSLTAADVQKIAAKAVGDKLVNFFDHHTTIAHPEATAVVRDSIEKTTRYLVLGHIKNLITTEKS